MRNPVCRVLLVAFLAVALVAGAGIAVGGDTAAASHAPPAQPPSVLGPSQAPAQTESALAPASTTRIRIDLRPNRNARWEVIVRYPLTDTNQTAPFDAVGERFVDGEVGPTPELFESFAAAANGTVDREMAIVDVERDAAVVDPDDVEAIDDEDAVAVGELRLAFVWTEFLAEDDGALVLGDALTTANNGTWLRSLEENQTIEVRTPDGYSVSGTPGASVSLQDNAVIIEGPRAFDDENRVAVVYTPTDTSGPPWPLLAAAIVLAAVVIAGGLVGYRRLGPDDSGVPGGTDAPAAEGASPAETESGAPPAETDAGGSDAEAGAEPEPEEDLSLLSDEERVERLLERNGGRMRQADIVGETGWSDAKVSQLLSAMAEEDRVEKLRLGRENLISLPDDDEPGAGGEDPSGDGTEA